MLLQMKMMKFCDAYVDVHVASLEQMMALQNIKYSNSQDCMGGGHMIQPAPY